MKSVGAEKYNENPMGDTGTKIYKDIFVDEA